MLVWLFQKIGYLFGKLILRPAMYCRYVTKPAAFEMAYAPDGGTGVRYPPWLVLVPGVLGGCGILFGLSSPRAGGALVVAVGLFLAAVYFGYTNATSKPETVEIRPLARSDAHVYTVRLPRGVDWKTDRAYQFMNHLLATFSYVTFRILAEPGAIRWQVLDLRLGVSPDVVIQAIRAVVPEADVEVSTVGAAHFQEPFYRYIFKFRHERPFPAPMAYVSDLRDYDPLAGLTNALSDLRPGERVIYTLHVGGLAPWAYPAGVELITKHDFNAHDFDDLESTFRATTRAFKGESRTAVYSSDIQRLLESKLNERLYSAALLLQIDTPEIERFDDLGRLLAHTDGFIRQPLNGLTLYQPVGDRAFPVESAQQDAQTDSIALLNRWTRDEDLSWRQTQLVLEPRELAALWHLPHKACHSPSITWASGQQTRLPQALVGKRSGVCLGDNHYGSQLEPVYWDENDRLTHGVIVGKTGTGKSTLFFQMLWQDIAAGRGVAVIDPHGAMVVDILRYAIDKNRQHDVVVLDLANEAHPIPLNLLASPPSMPREEAINRFVSTMLRVYPELNGTQMADTFRMGLRTLAADPQATVRDLTKVFDNVAYRDQLMAALDDPALDDFWSHYDQLSEGQRRELTGPIARRLRLFYSNPLLYATLCHPECLDIHTLMAENKIILISLRVPETKLPESERALVGATLLSQLQIAATSGAIRQRPYYLYVDEAHTLVTPALPKLFNEARKDGLALMLATQHFKQLAGDTLDAAMGNVGAVIAFACGPDDARTLAPFMKPGFAADDLVALDRFEAAVWLRDRDRTQPAFSLKTRKPDVVLDTAAEQRESILRNYSITRFTPKSRDEVFAWLKARYPRYTQAGTSFDKVDLYDPLD
jgi:hypothetical protein